MSRSSNPFPRQTAQRGVAPYSLDKGTPLNALDLVRATVKSGAHLYQLTDEEHLPFDYAVLPWRGGQHSGWAVLDAFTAGYILDTYAALSTEHRESFRTLSVTAMSRVALRLAGMPT